MVHYHCRSLPQLKSCNCKLYFGAKRRCTAAKADVHLQTCMFSNTLQLQEPEAVFVFFTDKTNFATTKLRLVLADTNSQQFCSRINDLWHQSLESALAAANICLRKTGKRFCCCRFASRFCSCEKKKKKSRCRVHSCRCKSVSAAANVHFIVATKVCLCTSRFG